MLMLWILYVNAKKENKNGIQQTEYRYKNHLDTMNT